MSGDSRRESLRIENRDYSLLVVAVMFVIFGLVVSNSVIPSYHEQQAIEKRRDELKQQIKRTEAENLRIADEIEALDDPYYMVQVMIEKFGYTHADPQ